MQMYRIHFKTGKVSFCFCFFFFWDLWLRTVIRLRCSCWDFYLQCTVWSLFIFKIFSHFFFVFNSIATQARCDARHADFFIFIFFFYFISFFHSFCARFQLVPWAGDLCTIEFWVGVREFQVVFWLLLLYMIVFFVDLVAWLFVGFFDLILVEAGRILISGYHIPGWGVFSLMCILYAVLMIEASACFAFCFVFSLLLWVL